MAFGRDPWDSDVHALCSVPGAVLPHLLDYKSLEGLEPDPLGPLPSQQPEARPRPVRWGCILLAMDWQNRDCASGYLLVIATRGQPGYVHKGLPLVGNF